MTIAVIWLVVGVKYIASVSFGKDSLAMLLMLIEKNYPLDYVVFYDTGMEFDSIYHNDCLDRVSCWCCRNKNLKELKSIYRYLPKYWKRLKGLEYRLCEPMKGNGKSISELEQRFKDEIEAELTSA